MEKENKISHVTFDRRELLEEFTIKKSDVIDYGRKIIKDIYKYYDKYNEKDEKDEMEKYLIIFYIQMFVDCEYETKVNLFYETKVNLHYEEYEKYIKKNTK